MEDDDHKELQLLPTPPYAVGKYSRDSPWPSDSLRYRSDNAPSLDLQLSISLRPADSENGRIEAVKWQAADQVRIAAMEKAYAERVKEMTKREMELAQSEFSRARHMWKRAREDVARVEKMKERATRRIDSSLSRTNLKFELMEKIGVFDTKDMLSAKNNGDPIVPGGTSAELSKPI
ncbi:uncharacterized protein LOC143540578 [Bidens hawaiensis]|uniref:uncharacterized protein LOC143540578 n=1 Tax=Bidens hawaiensis TaxID=980011 RepID=UPI00404ADFE5